MKLGRHAFFVVLFLVRSVHADELSDKIKVVTVEAGTQDRLTTDWVRNAVGTLVATSVERTSLDGLSRTTTLDADGDGDTDTKVVDELVLLGRAEPVAGSARHHDGPHELRT